MTLFAAIKNMFVLVADYFLSSNRLEPQTLLHLYVGCLVELDLYNYSNYGLGDNNKRRIKGEGALSKPLKYLCQTD